MDYEYRGNLRIQRMSDILETIKSVLDGPIDFPSQKFTEDFAFKGLIVGAVISGIAGFIVQDLKVLVAFFALTILIVLGIVLPPFPGYNKEQLEWYKVNVD